MKIKLILLLLLPVFCFSQDYQYKNGTLELIDGTVLKGSVEVDVSGYAFTKKEILFVDNSNRRSAYDRNNVKRIQAGSTELFNTEIDNTPFLASYVMQGKRSLLVSSSNEYGTLFFMEFGKQQKLLPDPSKPLKNNWVKNYKEILEEALSDCLYILPYIERTEYTLESLSNLFYIYNNCGRKKSIKEHELKKDWSSVFLVVHAGLGYSRLDSKENFVSDKESSSGVRFGIDLNLIPEYEYSKILYRVSLLYSSEKFIGGNLDYQDIVIRNDINLQMLTAKALLGYRFRPENPINFYILTGPSVQFRVNKGDEAFVLIDESGEERPLFTLDNPSIPLRYRMKPPNSALGWNLEIGNFFPIGLQRANIGIGLDHCWFLDNTSRAGLNKTTYYLKAGIELF